MFTPGFDPLEKLEEVERTSIKSLDLSNFVNHRISHQTEILQMMNNHQQCLYDTLLKQEKRIQRLEEQLNAYTSRG
jgi:hypothetical protein